MKKIDIRPLARKIYLRRTMGAVRLAREAGRLAGNIRAIGINCKVERQEWQATTPTPEAHLYISHYIHLHRYMGKKLGNDSTTSYVSLGTLMYSILRGMPRHEVLEDTLRHTSIKLNNP